VCRGVLAYPVPIVKNFPKIKMKNSWLVDGMNEWMNEEFVTLGWNKWARHVSFSFHYQWLVVKNYTLSPIFRTFFPGKIPRKILQKIFPPKCWEQNWIFRGKKFWKIIFPRNSAEINVRKIGPCNNLRHSAKNQCVPICLQHCQIFFFPLIFTLLILLLLKCKCNIWEQVLIKSSTKIIY
jgi:hypothetical protein